MSLALGGKPENVPGIRTISFLDAGGPARLSHEDSRPRKTAWVRSIILHCTVGNEPQIVRPGFGPSGLAERTIAAWASDARHAGAHIVLDSDGTAYCVADLLADVTYHAQTINEVSIGVELAQSHRLEIWSAQLDALVHLCDWLTARLGIQRQYHAPYRGDSWPVARLAAGGADCVGLFGHRDQTDTRGRGDPGDAPFRWLAAAGYEAWDFEQRRDIDAWASRQRAIGAKDDGVPGPATCATLSAAGKPCGMWVSR